MSFGFFLMAGLGVGAVSALLTWSLPLSDEARLGAAVGTVLATVSGVIALWLKKWTMGQEGSWAMKSGLLAMAIIFGLRVIVVLTGMLGVQRQGGDRMGFVVAFFAIYLVQQTLEVSYVHLEQKRQTGTAYGA
jgi:hypothetical protein